MARMSIDDMFLRDPRVAHLASLCGWSVRETRGALLDVWAICYDQMTPLLSVGLVNITAGNTSTGLADFAKHLLESELATVHRSTKLLIAGVEERIKYLIAKKESGRQGGLNSAKVRGKDTKQNHVSLQPVLKQAGSTPQAPGNPVVPDVVVASVPDGDVAPEEDSAASLRLIPAKPKAKKPKASGYTDEELAAVRRILEKLNEASGFGYQGAEAHIELIVRQLRKGVTEHDMRKIVAFKSHDWADQPDMRKYLTPETLFGPKTIARYLEPARSAFASTSSPPPPPSSTVQSMLGLGRDATNGATP